MHHGWNLEQESSIWTPSCICHFIQVCICQGFAFATQILFIWGPWTSTLTDLSPSLPHSLLPKTPQQLDHLSIHYLNTCKKICLNFPLCFWSALPPIILCGLTEMLVWPQAASPCVCWLLGAVNPPCIVPLPRVFASSHLFSTECLLWPCLFLSFVLL